MTKKSGVTIALAAGLVCGPIAHAGFRERFADPPPESRLQCWYHWTTTGLSEECLAADLKAMGEIGIGTAHVFMPCVDGIPPDVQPLDENWWKLWEVAVREAKRNDVKLGFHNCPGWSSSGGIWIKPEDSMKMLVSSATDVSTPTGRVVLPQPLTLKDFYRDVAVFALPVAKPPTPVRVTGDFNGDFAGFAAGTNALAIPVARGEKGGSVVFEYAEPFAPTTLVTTWNETQFWLDLAVSASEDGRTWKPLATKKYRLYNTQLTPKVLPLSVCPRARFFKLAFTPVEPPSWVKYVRRSLAAVSLSTLPLVPDVDAKNGAASAIGYCRPESPDRVGVPRAAVRDVTSHFRDGTLDLAAANLGSSPAGSWRIIRVGYTTTGKCCAPAPWNVCGLECDKLSKRGLDAHWPHMPLRMATVPGAAGTVAVSIIDSWEVGGQNWTEDFLAAFRRLRGYDLRPWLPAMAGYMLGTAEETAKLLFDVQRTVADLVAENYYDHFAEKCHALGLKSATESYDGPFDPLRCFAAADVPTGEFWLGGNSHGSPRVAASAGHLHGRAQIGAEAFTATEKDGRWQITPHLFRVHGDRAWLDGVSQLVYHSYVQQPLFGAKPGFSLDRCGTQFNRNTTWWPEGKWWADYVRRGQYVLQSGEPQADLLILAGDGHPAKTPYLGDVVAAGYSYDYCGAADLRQLSVRDGGVAMPGRRAYPVLWLGPDLDLTTATLAKVRALLDAGARVAATRPRGTPSLADDVAEWKALDAAIWNGARANLKTAATALDALRAFGHRAPLEARGGLKALRRVIEGRDFYFVVNTAREPFDGVVSFAGAGRPERWDAKTGRIEPLAWFGTADGRVRTRLSLRADESAFVSFRAPTAEEHPQPVDLRPAPAPKVLADWSADWTVASFTGPCAPSAPRAFARLAGWNESDDPALRYFSGRGVYEKTVRLPSDARGATLDLGDVREIANVAVNGRFLACLWEAPYRVKLPDDLREGDTVVLTVEVVNTWPNRMIGDAKARAAGAAEPQHPQWRAPQWVIDGRSDSGTGIYTWASWLSGWKADDEPLPSGLLGPVRLLGTK